MDTTSLLLSSRNARVATAVTLAAFVGYVIASDALRIPVLAVMTLGAAVVVVCGVTGVRRRPGPRAMGVWAAGCAVGLVGSVLYLRSLADEPSAIPIVGVFVLLVSFVGLVVSLFTAPP